MSVVLVSLVIGLAAFMFRAGLRFAGDRDILRNRFSLAGEQGDEMSHLLLAELIRRNHHRIPNSTPNFLLSPTMDYPAFFHKLLSYLPRDVLERFEWTVGPMIEGLHAAFIFLAAEYIWRIHLDAKQSLILAAITTVAFVLTPLLSSGLHRGSVLSPRPFGFLFGNVYLFAMFMFVVTTNLGFAALAVVSGAVTLVSSKFAVQAIIAISVLSAIFLVDPTPILLIIATLAISIIGSHGYVLRILKGAIRHSKYYRRLGVRISDYSVSFSDRQLIQSWTNLLRGNIQQAWGSLKKHPIHRLPVLVPWIFPFAWVLLYRSGPILADPLARAFVAWVMATIVAMLLTSLDRFKYLGEAPRYLDFGLFPVVMISLWWTSPNAVQTFAIVVAVSLLYLLVRRENFVVPKTRSPETVEIVEFVKNRGPTTIIAIPGRLAIPLAYSTEHDFVWLFVAVPEDKRLEQDFGKLFEGSVYPYIAPNSIEWVVKDYGAEILVFDKSVDEYVRQKWGIRYDFSKYPDLFENSRYVIKNLVHVGD